MSAMAWTSIKILVFLYILDSVYCSAGPPSYKYDYRRNNKKNQASPGIYFDPETGKFKRGDPPADLLVKSQQLREEVKQSKNQGSFQHLPFAKFSTSAPLDNR